MTIDIFLKFRVWDFLYESLSRISSFRSSLSGNALTIKEIKKICRVYREEYSSNKMISFSSRRVSDVDRIRLECECKQNKTAAAAGLFLSFLSFSLLDRHRSRSSRSLIR